MVDVPWSEPDGGEAQNSKLKVQNKLQVPPPKPPCRAGGFGILPAKPQQKVSQAQTESISEFVCLNSSASAGARAHHLRQADELGQTNPELQIPLARTWSLGLFLNFEF